MSAGNAHVERSPRFTALVHSAERRELRCKHQDQIVNTQRYQPRKLTRGTPK